ncbi:putative reverse transcriptase domain-containing protein [Tanacetum coccineum]|uniref:Reverse transcriptase domain-containing protein n=1 Tax=Tanacetum coccineum TaxID=301880 RepID=A0ABQ5ANL4_9ASTR
MLVDALLQHKVKGQVDRLVDEVGGLENKRAKLVDELAIKVAEQLQDLLPTIVAQVGDHVSNQGNIGSQNDKAADDSIPKDDRNVNMGNAYICWVEKMEAIQDISGCGDNQKVKYSSGLLTSRALTWWSSKVRTKGRKATVGMTWEYFKALMKEEYCPSKEMQRLETEFWNHAMVRAGHSAYTDRFHKLARLVPQLVTPETKRIKRNGSLKRTGERRGDGEESSKEGNVKGNNKRARTGKVFAIITNPIRKEYRGSASKCTNCNFYHNPETPCRACTNCNRLGYFARDCKAGPRLVNPLNAKNPTAACGACYECGGTDRYKSACPRAFVIGADEALQDPDIVTDTFSLNNHYATMLFDSGADYSFVSTTFVPLFDIGPRSLGFSYEIEIVSGQLVEINKVIHDCNLEIKGHTFDTDLMPFGDTGASMSS